MRQAFKNLFIEPYRVFFLVGVLIAISTGIHWFILFSPEVAQKFASEFSFPLIRFHSFQLIYCDLAFFIWGFLLTAFPRWVNKPAFSKTLVILVLFLLVVSEGLLFLAVRRIWAFYALLGNHVLLLFVFMYAFLKKMGVGALFKNKHPFLVVITFVQGGLGGLLALLAFVNPDMWLAYDLSIHVGIYNYLLLLMILVLWRVLPFFTGRLLKVEVNQSKHLGVWTLILVNLRLFSVLFFDHFLYVWFLDLSIFLLLLREVWRWVPMMCWKKIMQTPILLVLYIAIFWLLVFLSLSVLKIAAHFFMADLETHLLFNEKNFLHIFTLGCLGTLILGIMTRVTRGHGGLPLKLGVFGVAAILTMQIAMFTRVFLPLFPDGNAWRHYGGILWTVAFIFWGVGFFPTLFRSRQSLV